MEVFTVQSCQEGAECLYSVENNVEGAAKCGSCQYSPNSSGLVSFWVPQTRGRKHPAALLAKKVKKDARRAELRTQRLARDPAKRKVLVKAERAERETERNLIHATKNSGRSHRDGDHVAFGQITLDTKMQSTRTNPVVLLDELFKVREDAGRAGNPIGALVLRNRNGLGVVAMHELDFARLMERLK